MLLYVVYFGDFDLVEGGCSAGGSCEDMLFCYSELWLVSREGKRCCLVGVGADAVVVLQYIVRLFFFVLVFLFASFPPLLFLLLCLLHALYAVFWFLYVKVSRIL